ncbi:MAG: DUF642 domain-containing protein [Deltaproteobacteria bacterium]|nr:DUF642 domain-containing protein [Deltaproteobacteria bacterium]
MLLGLAGVLGAGLACGGDDDDDDDDAAEDDVSDDDADDDSDDDADDDAGDDDDDGMTQGCDVTIPNENIVANAGFELPDAGDSWIPLSAGATMGEWTVTGEGVDHMGAIMAAGEGDQCVDLNNLAPGGVTQTLSTTAGAAYELTFCYSGNPSLNFATQGEKETAVYWGDTLLGNYVFDTTGMTPEEPGWVTYTVSIPAELTVGSETELAFVSLADNGGVYGPAIDAVVVVEAK